LFNAAFVGNFEVAQLLLDHGADPNLAEDTQKSTPLLEFTNGPP
jgi:hypothetical protein